MFARNQATVHRVDDTDGLTLLVPSDPLVPEVAVVAHLSCEFVHIPVPNLHDVLGNPTGVDITARIQAGILKGVDGVDESHLAGTHIDIGEIVDFYHILSPITST